MKKKVSIILIIVLFVIGVSPYNTLYATDYSGPDTIDYADSTIRGGIVKPEITVSVIYDCITPTGLYKYEVRLAAYCHYDFIKKIYASNVSVYTNSGMSTCLFNQVYSSGNINPAANLQNVLVGYFYVSGPLNSCYVRMTGASIYLLTSGDWISVDNYIATILTN